MSPCARRMLLVFRYAEADRLPIALAPRTGLGDACFCYFMIFEGQYYDAPDTLTLTALERALPEEGGECEQMERARTLRMGPVRGGLRGARGRRRACGVPLSALDRESPFG